MKDSRVDREEEYQLKKKTSKLDLGETNYPPRPPKHTVYIFPLEKVCRMWTESCWDTHVIALLQFCFKAKTAGVFMDG